MRKVLSTIGVVIDTMGSLIIYAVIALAVLFIAGQAKHYYDVGYGIFSQQSKDAPGTGKAVYFTVEEGISATRLGEQLEAEGLVASAQEFLIQEKVSDYAGKYVAGTYALSSEMTTEEILRVISGTEPSRFAGERSWQILWKYWRRRQTPACGSAFLRNPCTRRRHLSSESWSGKRSATEYRSYGPIQGALFNVSWK